MSINSNNIKKFTYHNIIDFPEEKEKSWAEKF